MRRVLGFIVVALALVATGVVKAQQGAAPAGGAAVSVPPAGLAWAYGIAPGTPLPGAAPAAGAGGRRLRRTDGRAAGHAGPDRRAQRVRSFPLGCHR